MADLSSEELRRLFTYAPSTGFFMRRVKTGKKGVIGAVCVALKNGYVVIGIHGKVYCAHRLAFLYITGEWPSDKVDHIDGNRANNVWANLRDVDHSTNLQNLKNPRADNSLGVLGVHVHKATGKFRAQIKTADGRRLHLGLFSEISDARLAYLSAKRKLHVGCTI